MKKMAELKEKYKQLLENLLPEDEKASFTEHNIVNILKDRDHMGRRVLVVNIGAAWDATKVGSDHLFRMFYLLHVAAVLEPETQIKGVVVIVDCNGMGIKQVTGFNPSFSFLLLTFIQYAMPLRLKEVHMVHQSFVLKLVLDIFQPFIGGKLRSRIFFHGCQMSSLHKYMDRNCLPADYGGKLPKIDYTGKDWYPVVNGYLDHFKMMNSFGLKRK